VSRSLGRSYDSTVAWNCIVRNGTQGAAMKPFLRLKEAFRHRVGRQSAAEQEARPWWECADPQEPSLWPHAPVIERVVDDRVFLLGLDALYRSAIKRHERTELLVCAQRVAVVLKIVPADAPIEGYYAEHPDLIGYFRLVRALQNVPLARQSEVEALPEFRRLLAVTSSPIFGPPFRAYLLPKGNDPLSQALEAGKTELMTAWTVAGLTAAAKTIARQTDDYSLVGLAARLEDPVVLAALRESVVLYARDITGSIVPARLTFVWRVTPDLCAAAQRFVDAFNTLFGRELPPPTAQFANVYGSAFEESEIIGRCVRLGQATHSGPFYHWAVVKGPGEQLVVHEFWDDEVWTTTRFRGRHELPRM
jgi:hypothetical protein